MRNLLSYQQIFVDQPFLSFLSLSQTVSLGISRKLTTTKILKIMLLFERRHKDNKVERLYLRVTYEESLSRDKAPNLSKYYEMCSCE